MTQLADALAEVLADPAGDFEGYMIDGVVDVIATAKQLRERFHVLPRTPDDRTLVQYALRLPDETFATSEMNWDAPIVGDPETIFDGVGDARNYHERLRELASETGTRKEFDEGSTLVRREVVIVPGPFEKVVDDPS